ncbi:tape measure protein [Ewingella americana]
MAGEKQLGNIVYQVELDVGQLIESQRQVNARLDSMDRGFANTGRAADNTGRSFSALTKVASGLAAALSVQQITAYGNAWVTVSNKLANSVKANEDLFTVTNRVFEISQDTRASLEATATLYGRLERATRSAGTSTADLAQLTTTINKGLVVSGATAEEASSTMIQLSQALASGVLRGEEFNSISENGSRLAGALSDSLGVTVGQLRAMAAQGKLTTEVVVNGLLKQSDAIAKEFGNTVLTMSQSFTVATNNITKFVGEASSVNTTLNVFNQGVIALSENLDSVATVIGTVAVLMGGRFVGALAASTAAKVKSIVASREMSVANLQSANSSALEAAATLRSAESAKIASQAELSLAVIMKEASLTTERLAIAETRLSAARLSAVSATEAYNVALAANAAAQRTAEAAARSASIGMNALKGSLALIGGPAGAAMIAAAAVYYFFQRTQEARASAFAFADSISSVVTKMKEMNDVQLAAEIAKASQATKIQTSAIEDQREAVAGITRDIDNQTVSMRIYGSTASKLQNVADLTENLAIETAKLAKMEEDRSRTVNSSAIIQAKLNGVLLTGNDLLDRNSALARVAAGAMTELGKKIDFASGAKERFNATSLQVPVSKEGQKQIDQLTQQNELLSIQDKRERAVKAARLDTINAGEGNQNVINQVGELAGANYDLQQAEAARNKETKQSAADGKKAENQAENIAKKLTDLKQQSELAADSTKEFSREQAILTAQQSLGSAATQKDIALAGQYAAAKWDTGNAIRAQVAAEKLLPETKENASYKQDVADLQTALSAKKISQEQFNATSEQLEQQHLASMAQIRANQAVSPQQEAAGTVDPVQQLANENAKKLALIQQYEANKTITEQQGIALRNAANAEYENARVDAAWKIWSNQSQTNQLLGGAIDSLAGGASNAITGLLNGTQSLQESLANIGTTILNSVVSGLVEMGLQYVKNMIVGQAAATAALAATTAQATAAAAAWAPAAISASIATLGSATTVGTAAYTTALAASKGLAIAGARKNGGPVSAGSMYQVGEGGMPEIYKASSGKQYMIPGDNGSVISNKDMQGGGGGATSLNQVMNLTVNTTNGLDEATIKKLRQAWKTDTLLIIQDQQRPKVFLSRTK